jgi:hypothetical protein
MLLDEIQKSFFEKVVKTKEEAIKYQCEKLGIPIPDESVKNKRFNPYIEEYHEGFGELYYYNDGSDNGLFIVGFTFPDFEDSPVNFNFSARFQIIDKEPDWAKKP